MAATLARLDVRAARIGEALQFDYRVSALDQDIVLYESWLRFDALTGTATVARAVSLSCAGANACILVGMPARQQSAAPMPHLIALGLHVPAQTSLSRQVLTPLPLAESSPYLPDALLGAYAPLALEHVIFMVQAVPAQGPAFVASASPYAPEYLQIMGLQPDAQPHTLATAFPTQSLLALRRSDMFARPAFPPANLSTFEPFEAERA